MIVIIDMGVGNLSSVRSGFARAGSETVVAANAEEFARLTNPDSPAYVPVSGVVLPGVGAFGDAMFQLKRTGLLPVIRRIAKDNLPLLGICLGMQLLFSVSEEHGSHLGIGLLPGRIVRFPNDVKVPHMGWNDLVTVKDAALLRDIDAGEFVYFVHSYYAELEDDASLLAAAEYGHIRVPAVVGRGFVYGTQFHPEKSGVAGEKILRNFVKICKTKQGEER